MKQSGHTVLVTGGASGIGLSLSELFLEKGNVVLVCGRNGERLEQLRARHPKIRTIRCDVSDPAEVRRMVETIVADFPALSILVNNAGIQHRYDFMKDEDALRKIDEEIDINFRAVARLTKMLLPHLAKAKESAVINISSFLGLVPKASAPVYCATKAALHAFSRSLRHQLQGTAVRVFEVITPLVDTDITRGREDDKAKMSPELLAREVLRGIERNVYEIEPGRTKFVLALNRIVPSLIQQAMLKR